MYSTPAENLICFNLHTGNYNQPDGRLWMHGWGRPFTLAICHSCKSLTLTTEEITFSKLKALSKTTPRQESSYTKKPNILHFWLSKYDNLSVIVVSFKEVQITPWFYITFELPLWSSDFIQSHFRLSAAAVTEANQRVGDRAERPQNSLFIGF